MQLYFAVAVCLFQGTELWSVCWNSRWTRVLGMLTTSGMKDIQLL